MNMYTFTLTPNETTFLLDQISMFAEGPPDALLPGEARPYPKLLLKLLGVFYTFSKHEELAEDTIEVGVEELWCIREVAKTAAEVGGERVGRYLLLKVAEGLLKLQGER